MNIVINKNHWERRPWVWKWALEETNKCQICNKELIKEYHPKYPHKIINEVYLMTRVKGKDEQLIACDDCAWKNSWQISYVGERLNPGQNPTREGVKKIKF